MRMQCTVDTKIEQPESKGFDFLFKSQRNAIKTH